MGSKAALDAVEKRKISRPCQESNTGLPACRYTDRALPAPVYGSSVNIKSVSEESFFKIVKLKTWIIRSLMIL
jgi:hypothetical protein